MTSAEGAIEAGEHRWYAIRVQSNKEDTVRRNMDRKIQLRGLGPKFKEVVVPTEKIAEIKNGKKRTRTVKTYPGYVLINMIMDDETWLFVRETLGVGDFVGAGAAKPPAGQTIPKPFSLRPEEVAKFLGTTAGADGGGPKIKFENFDGVVEDINEQKGLVRVVVTIFGRATPVELQYWQVETV